MSYLKYSISLLCPHYCLRVKILIEKTVSDIPQVEDIVVTYNVNSETLPAEGIWSRSFNDIPEKDVLTYKSLRYSFKFVIF